MKLQYNTDPLVQRRVYPGTVAFVVRIAQGGYYVLGQADSMREAMIEARKRLGGGACFVRRREDGRRFTVEEMESSGWLTSKQERNAKWEHDNL